MVGLRKAQKEMTRSLLLEKGLELFISNGYAATTVDEIAAAVGTTRTTFYLHFPSKGELVRSLVGTVNEILTQADKPSLTEVAASNDPALIREFIARKFSQWPIIKPYITVAHQAAAVEPDIQDTIDSWFDDAIADIERGLNQANRFDPGTRRIRCSLAFGELEFISRRWMRLGWVIDSNVALNMMVESWCQLLVDPNQPPQN
jgi:AcrR family transcriptional regulator